MDDVPASEPASTGSDAGDPGASVPAGSAASPYSTGGGGVTLERRIAALYLAALLTGDTSPEIGDARSLVSVKFQQAPRVPVDDLVLEAKRADETEPSVVLAIGIRRRPNFVPSDDDTQKLVVELVRALLRAPNDGREHRLGLAVAGRRPHAEQLAELASLARNQMNAAAFFDLVEEEGRFRRQLRDRLGYLKEMVQNALPALDIDDADEDVVRDTTWRLLVRLFVLMPEVEEPDVSGWTAAQNRLMSVARGRDLIGAGHLLERLETLAAQYGPSAATIDRPHLRREVHSLLDAGRWRTGRAWELLNQLQSEARVRDRLGEGDEGSTLHFDRNAEGVEIIAAAEHAPAVLVTGESGVGKSALVMDAAAAAVGGGEVETEIVCLNLRQLPQRPFDLVSQLGTSLEMLLSDLSAPRRLLIVDAADAAAEGSSHVFGYVIDAARASGAGLIAVTSNEGRQVVHDVIVARMDGQAPAVREVAALTDAQLDEIAVRFPALVRLVANDRSRELLKRLIVVDLLVRSDFSGTPLSDVDAMNQVWAGLVRRHGRQDRGMPDAREQTLLRLAQRELSQGSTLDLANELDATALDGLRRDGLVRSPEGNPWQAVPDFAHDEIRRYAVARVLLADGDPAAAVLRAGAPRWALSAARLACQAILAQSDRAENRIQGRLDRVQSAFETIVDAGYGARWADVPDEALLTLGDPSPLLADAWPALRSGDHAGLQRLVRIVEQRHGDGGAVDPLVVEPIIALLLEDAAPWRGADEIAKLLRHWLRGLVVRDAAEGHPLRVLLRERLLAVGEQAEAAQRAREEQIAAARAAMTDEEREARQARSQALFPGVPMLGGRRRRRPRPELPREISDDTFLELLALLGPDLGDQGEKLLRRVAEGAPWDLGPTVEEPGTGGAIGSYGHGLLADLVEAYYLDDNEDDEYGSGLLDDGIRRHTFGGVGMPLAAWYRGPFGPLFQTDFRRGVAVLNRLLNHAARARVRSLASIGDRWNRLTDKQIDDASVELRITGAPQKYVGDPHVWLWYRGTGVGPYPCMSALQALERVCDQIFALGIPMEPILGILMEGCENLAMPALVVGLLVRHIENAGTLLDPFLAEPYVWQLEFNRTVNESVGLAASSEGVAAPERRTWSLREAASWLALNADPERADALRLLGEQLVARAREIEADEQPESGTQETVDDAASSPSFATLVAGWASALDRSRYRAYAEGDQVYVESSPPEDVEEALRPGNEELRRGNEVLRIHWRYYAGRARGRAKTPPPVGEELANDLAIAEALVADPPTASAVSVSQMAAAIAAHAVEVVVLRGEALPEPAKRFAVHALLTVAQQEERPNAFDSYHTFYEQGADRLAARAIPLLLLPAAAELRALVAADGERSVHERIAGVARHLAHAVPNETRVHLARGLDAVWTAPCVDEGRCHHAAAVELAIETMRDCAFGPWDPQTQRRRVERLEDPFAESLDAVADTEVFVARLDAGIRALGVAATQPNCVTERARQLLAHVLDAQRRGLLAHEEDYDDRNTHTLEAARALLNLAASGDDAPVHDGIAAYAGNGTRLEGLLRSLAASAEETAPRANAARRLWPAIIGQVLELHTDGHVTFDDRYYGRSALSALMPTPAHDIEFLYRELGEEPIRWRDPLAWEQSIDAWIAVGTGDSHCVDAFVELLGTLPADDQMRFGLPRVAVLVGSGVEDVARRSYLLSAWLKDTRQAAVDAGVQTAWQELVDALVVAGDRGLAPYSE